MTSPLIRSLFDDSERRPLTVSELTANVRGTLESRFTSVWVEGEISNFNAPSSGHWYFTLKDETAQLRAACFRSVNFRARFRPFNGLLVRVRGRLTVYDPRGEYQLEIKSIAPVGAGALRIAFEQLRDRLAAEGLFEQKLKRELPLLPRRIGVITSTSGAALGDIIRAIRRRTRTVHLLIVPTRVQGEGAGREIARAIRNLNAYSGSVLAQGRIDDTVDVIIVARGGGSAEDLWAFNEEEVARAIRASAIPIISGVGHETDFTIADFAADMRAATPTAAAEIVATREDEIAARVSELTRTLAKVVRYRLIEHRARAQKAAMSHGFAEVRAKLRGAREEVHSASRSLELAMLGLAARARRRVDVAASRLSPEAMRSHATKGRARLSLTQSELEASARARLDDARGRLGIASASLDALSPLAVLGRGYALARDEQGRLLRDARSTEVGRRVNVRLAKGALGCRIEEIE
jgi:exodeoxyribonuclease VII large subunit